MDLKDIRIESAGNGFPAELKRIRYKSGVDGVEDWAMVLPPKDGTKWLVCIHGHGSLGDQLYTRKDIHDWYLPRFLEQAQSQSRERHRFRSPAGRGARPARTERVGQIDYGQNAAGASLSDRRASDRLRQIPA